MKNTEDPTRKIHSKLNHPRPANITGVKATLVDSYGAYSDSLRFEMAKKLQALHPIADQ